MKKQKKYTDIELLKVTLENRRQLWDAARTIYSAMPWTFVVAFQHVLEYITNPNQESILEIEDGDMPDTDEYTKYTFFKDMCNENDIAVNMILDGIKHIDGATSWTKRRIRQLKTLRRKLVLDNFGFYVKVYGKNKKKSFEELKTLYRNNGEKDMLKREFLDYIRFTDIDKKKQSKRYTVSRDLDKDVYYETTEGRLAKIKGYLYKKYVKQNKIDIFSHKAFDALDGGIYVKPMKLINKVLPKASEAMKLLLASMFEGIKECHMIIDTNFKKAYEPSYCNHQDTDGDKASNYSCMSCEGNRAQNFYGLIHGCKVVRWELADGEQVGRCIMYEWNGRRHFIRIYGKFDYHRTMINMLEAQMKEGDIFGRNKAIDDIKLDTDLNYDSCAMYLDGNYYGLRNEGDKWYMVAKNYDTDCKTTSGDALENLMEDMGTCEHCGRRINNDDGIWVDDRFYCDAECAEEDGYRCCERCGEWEREDNCVWVEGAGYYCSSSCAESAGYAYDSYNGEWVDENDVGETKDGRYVTTQCGAADYYNVDEDDVEWSCDESCWVVKEKEEEEEENADTIQSDN